MDGILTLEAITAYGLGILTAGLIALVLIPIVHVRAVRNTRWQMHAEEEARAEQSSDVARDIAPFRTQMAVQSSAPHPAQDNSIQPSEPVRRNNVVRLAVVRAAANANAASASETTPDDSGGITNRAATEIRAAAQRIDGRVSHIRHYGLPVHERRTKRDRDSSHP